MTDIRPVGIDISKYQHPVDWAKMDAANPPFVYHRATIGSLYVDPFFLNAVENLKRIEVPFSAYHVIRPDFGAAEQALNFINALKLANCEKMWMPPVLDCELDCGKSQAHIAQVIWDFAHIIEDEFDKKPIIYSRKSWTDQFIGDRKWLNDYEWWMAYYPSGDWTKYDKLPEPPRNVEQNKVIIHQVSSNGTGKNYGVASLSIDVNYWLKGGFIGLDQYISDYTGSIPPIIPPKTNAERITTLEVEARKRGWQV